jgi:low-affinity ferrous iron transport protein
MLRNIMIRAMALLRQPGRKGEIRGTASECILVAGNAPSDEEKACAGFAQAIKHSRLDRWLDAVVAFSGSCIAFFVIVGGVVIWCLLGIRFGTDENWQVIISDVQALLCYIYDSFLVRQLLNKYEDDMSAIAQLTSRSDSHLRMLRLWKSSAVGSTAEGVATLVGPSMPYPRCLDMCSL